MVVEMRHDEYDRDIAVLRFDYDSDKIFQQPLLEWHSRKGLEERTRKPLTDEVWAGKALERNSFTSTVNQFALNRDLIVRKGKKVSESKAREHTFIFTSLVYHIVPKVLIDADDGVSKVDYLCPVKSNVILLSPFATFPRAAILDQTAHASLSLWAR